MSETNEYIVHSERNYEGYRPGTIEHIYGPERPYDYEPELFGNTREGFYEWEDVAKELNRLRGLIERAVNEVEFDKLPRDSFRQAMINLYCEIRPQDEKKLRAEWPADE